MKVETPQILWNSEGDKGINAALNSISLLESGLMDPAPGGSSDNDNATAGNKYGHVMVTAGNTDIINLWKLSFPSSAPSSSANNATNSSGIFQKHNPSLVTTSSTTASSSSAAASTLPTFSSNTKIAYLCSLTRQEQSVNTVAFSPDGLHLATGGETGAIVLWSVPPSMRGNGNGRHFWSTVEREQDLSVRIVCRSGQGICDISWSADSKRFIVGTIDHSVFVCEDKNYDANHRSVTTGAAGGAAVVPVDSEWEVVYRNTHDHTHYVQGVAYDPLGVYLASMGSDRTVRVFPRKTPPKSKKKVLRPAGTNNSTPLKEGNASNNQENLGNGGGGSGGGVIPPIDHQRMVDQLLTESKLEISSRSKMIKFRRAASDTNGDDSVADNAENNNATAENNQANNNNNRPARRNLYADESTLQSFFRRLSWTADGAFLVTPSALWYADEDEENSGDTDDNKASPSFATYLFARHQFDEPYKVLSGLEKVRGGLELQFFFF